MDELNSGLNISLHGTRAVEALARFREQLKAWDLTMPSVEPLVLDFGLNDFPRTGLIEYWVANEVEAGYCGKFLYVQDGQTCPLHSHRTKMETFFLVKGSVNMFFDGDEQEMGPGDVLFVPQDKFHAFTGLGPALLLEVSTPCLIDDNYFEDQRIPIGGNYTPPTG